MSLKKTAEQNSPHAIYACRGWVWRVLKTYQTPTKEQANVYASWLCVVSSPFTAGGTDMGDTYVHVVVSTGILVAATPEWIETYNIQQSDLPTPKTWLREWN